MVTRRQKQVSSLVQKELGELLEKRVSDPRLDFVTITSVEVSPDLRQAYVYVTTLGNKQDAMQGLDHAVSFLRRELASRLALRYVPELIFRLDESLERGERIHQLLDEIQRQSPPSSPPPGGIEGGSGILNINKPAGMTSHDVVDRVRQMSGQRRVGHAGTLDPQATGVLVVCLGQATRVAEYLMASDKVYRAEIRLGVTTDTHDAEGEVTFTAEVDASEEEVQQALASFIGLIQQVPPMYSALKREGTPLHRLARRGITVEREPRSVEIHNIELLDWLPPLFTIRVECSPGTYIRALARDLGQKLGCGAHLQSLTRLASGHLTLEEAVSLDELAETFAQGNWQEFLHPLDEALLDFDPMIVDAQTEKRIRHGQQVIGPDSPGLRRAYSQTGEFIAILGYDPQMGLWQPKKVFNLKRA